MSDIREYSTKESLCSLDEGQLRAFLQAFYAWYERAGGPVQQCSRGRVLLVCLLIRFAGLRLGEALALDDVADIDESARMLHIRGKWARSLPLPRTALNKIVELRDAPCSVRERGRLCLLDQGYVRKIFALRAAEAGLSGVNPTSLRNYREQELLHHGVPLFTVERFLGRMGTGPGPEEVELFREAFRQWEDAHQTGRHNIVSGTVELLRKGELSCLLGITTPTGLVFAVRCSTRVLARLDLANARQARASVRSLQVELLQGPVEGDNVFRGTVVDILEKGEEARVMVRLQDGRQEFCSIVSLERVKELALKREDATWIRIRPCDFTFGGNGMYRSVPKPAEVGFPR